VRALELFAERLETMLITRDQHEVVAARRQLPGEVLTDAR
jgi:hypothetical protein